MVWRTGEGDPYALLASLLLEERGIEPLPPIARTERGKPWFPDYPHLHFSLSRSGGLSLCALARTPVGADLELVRPRSPGLPRYVLSGREYEWYEGRGSRWEDFYILWTLKEARVKCTGEGIFRRPAREVSVPLLRGGETDWEGFRFTVIAGESREKGDFFGAVCRSLPERK